jgi:Secretion system C-terminal sorting domain
MKKNIYTFIFLFLFSFNPLIAQQWIENKASQDMIPTQHQIAEIEAVNDSVVWILTQYVPETFTEAIVDTVIYSKILRTTNSGNSWQVFNIPQSKGFVCVNIEASDSLNAWITCTNDFFSGIGNGILFATKDGGRTWTEKLRSKSVNSALKFFDKDNALAISATVGATARTTNGGETWVVDTTTVLPFKGDFIKYGNIQLIKDTLWLTSDLASTPTVRTAKFFRSTDKGKTWQEYKSGIPQNDGWLLLSSAFRDGKNGLIVGVNSNNTVGTAYVNMLQSNNGGESWEYIPADLPASFPTYQRPQLTYIPKSTSTYMLSGVTNTISSSGVTRGFASAYTKDGGLTWANIPTIVIPNSFGLFLPSNAVFSSPSVGWRANAFLKRNGVLYKWDGGSILLSNKDLSENISLKISPNPSTGIINIQWKSADNTPPQYLRVLDVLGRVVYEKKGFGLGETTETIDLQTVPNGVYFIDYQTVMGRKVEKVQVQH